MIYDENTTIDDALAAWDRGESIFSVEMGGLGPGYEQAIQVLIVELLRDQRTQPLPATQEAWARWGEATITRLNDSCGGFSGGQVGAAKSCAGRMLTVGYSVALDEMKARDPGRLIQISSRWPRAPQGI